MKEEELEDGIWDPLGVPASDYYEDGSEKGIAEPWHADHTQDQINWMKEKQAADERWRRLLQGNT